jgi:cytidyltransferase-like protein
MKNIGSNKKKVFVSGCFDMLHSGHVEFFRRASKYGDLYVSIGSDKTVRELKNRPTICSEKERLFMVGSIKYVYKAFIARGSGQLDFLKKVKKINPDYFIVNKDGDKPEKRELCRKLNIKYVVLKRSSAKGITPRSTTEIRRMLAL